MTEILLLFILIAIALNNPMLLSAVRYNDIDWKRIKKLWRLRK